MGAGYNHLAARHTCAADGTGRAAHVVEIAGRRRLEIVHGEHRRQRRRLSQPQRLLLPGLGQLSQPHRVLAVGDGCVAHHDPVYHEQRIHAAVDGGHAAQIELEATAGRGGAPDRQRATVGGFRRTYPRRPGPEPGDGPALVGGAQPPIILPDTWDGYAAERQLIVEAIGPVADNLVVLTGDFHSAAVAELRADPFDLASPVVGSEFMATSISSSFFDDNETVASLVNGALAANPQIKWFDSRRGYTVCEVTPDQWLACFSSHGLAGEVRPMSAGTPFANVLFRVTVPAHASATTRLPSQAV